MGTELNIIFFIDYVMGDDNSGMGAQKIYGLLDNGHNLPIDWQALYAYFDERLNDPENELTDELISMSLGRSFERHFTVKNLLDQYRDKLYNPYDMI